MKTALLCLLLTASSALAVAPMPKADPTPQPSPVAPPVIHVPPAPSPPNPPAPKPSPVTLGPGQLLLITDGAAVADDAVTVVASPDGLVKISNPPTPCTLYGNFIDPQATDDDGRTFAAGQVFVVKAAGVGKVELLVFSKASGKKPCRLCLNVNDGSNPAPPTPPNPPTPTDPLTAALQAAYTADAGSDKAASLASLKADYADILVAIPGYFQIAKTPTVALATEWMSSVVTSVTPTLTPDKLAGVRKAIAADFAVSLGSSLTAPVDQTKFTAEVTRINNALGGIK